MAPHLKQPSLPSTSIPGKVGTFQTDAFHLDHPKRDPGLRPRAIVRDLKEGIPHQRARDPNIVEQRSLQDPIKSAGHMRVLIDVLEDQFENIIGHSATSLMKMISASGENMPASSFNGPVAALTLRGSRALLRSSDKHLIRSLPSALGLMVLVARKNCAPIASTCVLSAARMSYVLSSDRPSTIEIARSALVRGIVLLRRYCSSGVR